MSTATASARRRQILGVPAADLPWLVYLALLVWHPIFDPASTWRHWVVAGALCVVFVPIYGWTHRVIGTRSWLWRNGVPGAVLGIAGMLALLLVGATINTGVATFAIFAMAAAGKLSPRRTAFAVMGAAMASLAIAFFISPVPPVFKWPSFLSGAMLGPLIGLGTLFARERRATDAKLRMAQQEVEQLAAIAERERIARDLHDLLGHTLSTITLKAELAANLVDADPTRATGEMRDVEQLSRRTLAEVRSVVRGYRATGLAGEVVSTKLVLEAAGIEFDYFVAKLQLQPAAESVLALALREAVTNVVRHAAASSCTATIEADGAFVTLTVEDDGLGIVAAVGEGAAPQTETPGFGISAMRERARALGGFVSVEPSSAANRNGTRLTVGLPVGAALMPGEPEPAVSAHALSRRATP